MHAISFTPQRHVLLLTLTNHSIAPPYFPDRALLCQAIKHLLHDDPSYVKLTKLKPDVNGSNQD